MCIKLEVDWNVSSGFDPNQRNEGVESHDWRAPKFLGRPTRGSNYVEMRKELELRAAPNFQH